MISSPFVQQLIYPRGHIYKHKKNEHVLKLSNMIPSELHRIITSYGSTGDKYIKLKKKMVQI